MIKTFVFLAPLLISFFSVNKEKPPRSRVRKKSGFTQQIIADKLGIYVSQLKRYEAGTSQPALEVFRKIALALNVSADMLLFGENGREERDFKP